MARLIETREEAIESIEKFQSSAKEIKDRLSHVRAWYAFQVSPGVFKFGPSKFIGYCNMSSAEFLNEENGLDGRKTEVVLQNWFDEVPRDSTLGRSLHIALGQYLDQFGKIPSKIARINVLKEPIKESENDSTEAKIIQLIVELDRLLPLSYRSELRRRLSA